MKSITPFYFKDNSLYLLDQRKLPLKTIWIQNKTYEDVAISIKTMVVRGAPAIGCVAAWGFYLGAAKLEHIFNDKELFSNNLKKISQKLGETRPTAVNLFWALDKMSKIKIGDDFNGFIKRLYDTALSIEEDDRKSCHLMGENGLLALPDGKISVLTHCNAGALATAGYGTALGVIRSLHQHNRLKMVFADDTRPRQQGGRLTIWELMEDNIPVTLIADTAAGYTMAAGKIDAVVVGADRIAKNGDVANKIGTYMVAVLAHRHKIPFFIAAPVSTFDFSIETGDDITIENRSPDEVRKVGDTFRTVPTVPVENPAFDVTPNELITGIITEKAVLTPPYTDSIKLLF